MKINSLHSRMAAAVLLLLVLGMSALGALLVRDSESRLMELRITQAKHQANTLAQGSLDGLVSRDFEILEGWVASSLPSKDYAYAALVRPDGLILTHTDLSLIAKKTTTTSKMIPMSRKESYQGRPVFIFIHPAVIGKKHLANAHVAFYLDAVSVLRQDSITDLLFLLTFSLFIIGAGTYFLTKHFVRPLSYLRMIISEADLNKKISIDSDIRGQNDEVGELARTFESMSNRIAITHGKLKAEKDNLEKRVKDRTADLEDLNTKLVGSEARITAIVDNVADAIVTIDAKGLIESFNKTAEQLFGYSAYEVTGKNISILTTEPVRSEHNQYIERYFKTGRNKVVGMDRREVQGMHKDGSHLTLEISVNSVVSNGVTTFIGAMRDVSERKKMIEDLTHLADHDGLTNLYNRTYFTQELERIVQRVVRGKEIDCALLFIDLDNFKYLNDTMGHAAGDMALIDISKIIKRRLRNTDIAARIGGDEFVILLMDVSKELAKSVADSYRQQISEYKFLQGKHPVELGCSIGVKIIAKGDQSAKNVIAHADFSCQHAKQKGRNQTRLFQNEDIENFANASEEIGWSSKIRDALKNDQFILNYQPIENLITESSPIFEVLVRMVSKNGLIIMPGGFLPSAERFGLMNDIDSWVINCALNQLIEIHKDNPSVIFSLNISPRSLESEKLSHQIESFVAQGLNAEKVIFEITESTAISSFSTAMTCLKKLRALGFRVALDDFGTGFSTFSYLQELPVDIIKIDGRFVSDLPTNTTSQAMVRAMTDIAHTMGLEVIAEYVENDEILVWLQENEVDYAQGFHISKPINEEQLMLTLPNKTRNKNAEPVQKGSG